MFSKFLVNFSISATILSVVSGLFSNETGTPTPKQDKHTYLVEKIDEKGLTDTEKERIQLIKDLFTTRGFDGATRVLQGDASKLKKPEKDEKLPPEKTAIEKDQFNKANPDKDENYTVIIERKMIDSPGKIKEIEYNRVAHPTMDVNPRNEKNKSVIANDQIELIKELFETIQDNAQPTAFVHFFTKKTWYRAYIMRIDGYLSSMTTPCIALLIMGIDLDIINAHTKLKPFIPLYAKKEQDPLTEK